MVELNPTLKPITTHYDDNNHQLLIIDDPIQFGKQHVSGMQKKGTLKFPDAPTREPFLKLDALTPNQNGSWEDQYDYKYSAVAEAMVSCLARHIQPEPYNGRFVDYRYQPVANGKQVEHGTLSKNFLKNDYEFELNLGIRNDEQHGFVDQKYFANEIYDQDAQTRLDNLTKQFVKMGMDEPLAKQFLIQETGFDILTGNSDRIGNPGNFTVIQNFKTNQTIPLNMDYGRCARLPSWTPGFEAKYSFDDDPEFHEMQVKSNVSDMIQQETSMLSGTAKTIDALRFEIEFLNDHHFKPFQIDMAAVNADLAALNDQIQSEDVPYKNFAKMKIITFKQMLQHPQLKTLYQDISNSQSFKRRESKND